MLYYMMTFWLGFIGGALAMGYFLSTVRSYPEVQNSDEVSQNENT
jgi:hypothetical protein